VESGTVEDLSTITFGEGSGSMSVEVVDQETVRFGDNYKVEFYSTADTRISPNYYQTSNFTVVNTTTSDTLFNRRPFESSTPVIEGYVIEFKNEEEIEYDFDRIGWVGNYQDENEMFNLNPRNVDGYETNWIISARPDDSPNGELSPDDFELRWADENIYYPPRFQTSTYLRDSINVVAVNLATDEVVELLILDRNENDEFDIEDELVIMEQPNPAVRKLRHRFTFRVPAGENSVLPGDGEVFRISHSKPFAGGDFFQFSLAESSLDNSLMKKELERITVVPNPYLGYSIFEPRLSESTSGRGERVVKFINLPPVCTIRIFNIRGELIQTLSRNTGGTSDGTLDWDLRTKDGLDLAYGVYVYHVDVPGIGEKVGKIAIVK
jgi:hypothetical protein